MKLIDAAKSEKHGAKLFDSCFDFSNVPFNYVAMIVFESKINAKRTDGTICRIGDKIRVLSDKVPEFDDFGNLVLTGATMKCIDKTFFTVNGIPAQGEDLNRAARVSEVHLRYDK